MTYNILCDCAFSNKQFGSNQRTSNPKNDRVVLAKMNNRTSSELLFKHKSQIEKPPKCEKSDFVRFLAMVGLPMVLIVFRLFGFVIKLPFVQKRYAPGPGG